ncbi:MAG: DUF3108 domain-containing protein [Thermomicrobiales bacterium]
MLKRILTLLGLVAILTACGGGANTPAVSSTGTTSAASSGAVSSTGGTRSGTPTTRTGSASPTVPGAGLPPIPTNTPGAGQATAPPATPGTPGTPRPLPSASPVAFRPAPWQPGDRTIFDVTTKAGNQPAGTASFTLGREFDTDTLSALLQIGTTQDRIVMGWTTATLAPISELRTIVTPDGTIDISSEFHEGGSTIQVIDRTGTNIHRLNMPPKYYANDQFLMILRALPFKEGYQGALVLVPSMGDPATLNSVVTVTGQETVTTSGGPIRAWRVEAQFENNPTIQVLWYSVDAPNYLVKYDNGRYIYTVTQHP